jgi:uncharacterized protein
MVSPFYPGRAPIDAYGNGGFRFAGMSHRGSLLLLPSGIRAWEPLAIEDVRPLHLREALAEAGSFDFLLLGTGRVLAAPAVSVRQAFAEAAVGLEIMNTGAACRTYNVLLGEGRAVAAALIAVA